MTTTATDGARGVRMAMLLLLGLASGCSDSHDGDGTCPPNTAVPGSCRICADGSCGAPSCDSSGFVGFVCPEDGSGVVGLGTNASGVTGGGSLGTGTGGGSTGGGTPKANDDSRVAGPAMDGAAGAGAGSAAGAGGGGGGGSAGTGGNHGSAGSMAGGMAGAGGTAGAAGIGGGAGAGSSGGSGDPGATGGAGAGTCPPNTAVPASCRLCADGSCGAPSCDGGGFAGFVCPEDGASGGGGGGSGSADAGVAFVLPDCQVGAAVDGTCSASDLDECCQGDGTHLRCDLASCAGRPSCEGAWEPMVGSTTCGGYQPCASKRCGDACTLCDPNDSTCAETQEVKACDSTGQCVSGAADCSQPDACELLGPDTCPSGQVCCAIGRCGPLATNHGVCEPVDPQNGGCMPCACETRPGGCPICNSPDTPILTPDGERAIAEIREGDLVMSVHEGQVVAVPVLATRHVRVFDHAVVRLSLSNGNSIEVSGSHPAADGRRLDSLGLGDALGQVTVVAVELVPYEHDRTYDILPASDSGTYFAGGALLGSTLHVDH